MPVKAQLLLIVTWLFLLLISGCREVYEPELEAGKEPLVVDAHITNLEEVCYVKLTRAVAYNEGFKKIGVISADVWLQDNDGNEYHLIEATSGLYKTNPLDFIPSMGKTYQLHIRLQNGETYESTPQSLLPTPHLDSLYGNLLEKEFIYKDVWGKVVSKYEIGASNVIDFSSASDTLLQYRIATTLLLGYTYIDNSTKPYPTVIYKWKKFYPDKTYNLTGENTSIQTNHLTNYSACFFPFNEYLYELTPDEHAELWFLQARVYSLGKEAQNYYKQVNKQLSSSGAIFDPISTQVEGNMYCTSDPELQVLGFFDLSACSKVSRWVKPLLSDNIILYRPCMDLDSIDEFGLTIQVTPNFWKY